MPVRTAHRHITCCDKVCAEDHHHILMRTHLDELFEHGHGAPHCTNLRCSSVSRMKRCICVRMPVRRCVECIHGENSRGSMVYDTATGVSCGSLDAGREEERPWEMCCTSTSTRMVESMSAHRRVKVRRQVGQAIMHHMLRTVNEHF